MRRTTAGHSHTRSLGHIAIAVATIIAASVTVLAGRATAEPTPASQDEQRCLAELFAFGPAGAAPDTAPSATTAASVVEHYVDVGQRIRILAKDRGTAAASKLWEAFRYIRIHDALIDPAKRDATDARLRRIDDSLAAHYAR